MAHYFAKPSPILCLLLALFLSFGVSLYSARIVTVEDICYKHINSASCVYILNSIKGVAVQGVDLDAVSPVIIQQADMAAYDNNNQLSFLMENTTDPDLNRRYTLCRDQSYYDASFGLHNATNCFESGDYNGMNSYCATAVKSFQDCDSIPPSDPSHFPIMNSYVEDLTGSL